MANTGMKGLLVWCKKHTEGYRDVRVTNMTSSWKDGLAFCALLHRFRPDLINFDSLSKENLLYNNQLAFGIAEKELGIAALLDAEDMAIMTAPDRLSVMTYLAQYYNCFRHCKPEENVIQRDLPVINPVATGSPAKGPTQPRRLTDESICGICGKHVHLVQRYFDEGKLYHRTCHRNDSLEKIRGKNYFVKQQKYNEDTKKVGNGIEHDSKLSAPNTDFDGSTPATKTSGKPDITLPNLVESLGDANVKTINIGILASTPSPSTEKNPWSNISHTETPSLISELPIRKEGPTHSSDNNLVAPKPRTRTILSSTEDTTSTVSPAPIAQPRTRIIPKTKKEEQDNEDGSDYDKVLNPFGTDSGSDSDTTLSSTSSEDDEMNPFINIANKQKKTIRKLDSVGDNLDKVKMVKESESKMVLVVNPFQTGGDAGKEIKEDPGDGYGNPFGDPDEQEETSKPEKVSSDKFNPFSPDFEDKPQTASENSAMEKKKKRPAPVPPAVVCHPVQKGVPSPQKKATAPRPPRPPGWKDGMSQKMAELNKENEKDPHFTKKDSPKPKRPQPLKSPVMKTIDHKNRLKVNSSKARSAPGYGYPLVKRKVEIKMSEEEISTELKVLDIKLTDYETKGVKLEELLRFAMNNDSEWSAEEDQLLQEWFDLVNKKNILLRQESDLVFQMQQQRLEQEHADIEFQLRKLFNKPETAKTGQDKKEEENLLQKLLEVVERRNVIINSIEEERLKEAEEDSAYEQMMRLQKTPSKKKKKNKVKKMFSKKEKREKRVVAKEAQE